MAYLFLEYPVRTMPRITHFGFRDLPTIADASPHRHFGYELVYCVDGEARMQLVPGDKTEVLRHDDLLIVPPKIKHCFERSSTGITYFWIGIQTTSDVAVSKLSQWPSEIWNYGSFEPPPATHITDGAELHLQALDDLFVNVDHVILHGVSDVLPLFTRLRDEVCRPRRLSRSYLYAKLLQLITTVARTNERYIPGEDEDTIRKVASYLRANLYRRLALDDLCSFSGLSRSYLCRAFHARMGKSPMAYLRTLRVEEAKRLLGRGQSLESVTKACGFSSSAHLSLAFSEQVGRTPGRYARLERWTTFDRDGGEVVT